MTKYIYVCIYRYIYIKEDKFAITKTMPYSTAYINLLIIKFLLTPYAEKSLGFFFSPHYMQDSRTFLKSNHIHLRYAESQM